MLIWYTDVDVISCFSCRYVLRRILRRAVRFMSEKLHAPPGFLASLVYVVVDILVSFIVEV
jgi:alanyl-tRNA synthetase